MKRTLLFSFFLLLFSFSFSTTYYISNAGNDANAGTSSATPWRTIAKLNSRISTLKPGDNVVFRRGDYFTGEIILTVDGQAGSPITFGAYGSGAKPIIAGMYEIKNWVKYSGNIWYASAPSPVRYFYANGKFMTLARYPNSGFLLVSTGGTTKISSKDITQANNYWAGANIRMRTTKWTWEHKEIASSTSGGELTFVAANKYTPDPGYGFYLDNKFQELDMETEWYYDASAKRIFFWAPKGVDPNTLFTEGSYIDYGIFSADERFHIVVTDLSFRGQAIDGVHLFDRKSANNTIKDCEFYETGVTSVSVGGSNITVTNNYFEGARGRGVKGHEVKGGTFTYNTMKNMGRQNGFGISGNQGMNGFHFTMTDDVYIAYNRIDSVGYTGITSYVSNSLVEKNVVNTALLNLNDGACIYTFADQTHHTTIRDNIVYNAVGNNEGVPAAKVKPAAFGIYIDNKSYEVKVLNNTIINASTASIFLNSGVYNTEVANNVMYGAGRDMMQLEEKILKGTTVGNYFHDNVIVSLDPDVSCLRLISEFNTFENLGVFENNYMYNLYNPYMMRLGRLTNKPLHSVDQWDFKLPDVEVNNKISPFQWDWEEVTSIVSSNLISNGTFDANASGWTTTGSNAQSNWLSKGIEGGSYELKMTGSSPSEASHSTAISGGLKSGTYYQMKFSLTSTKYENIEVNVRGAGGKILHSFEYPLSPTRRDYVKLFKAPSNESEATLEFRVAYTNGHNFILDNVEVYEVETQGYTPTAKAKIFVNHTDQNKSFNLTTTYQDVDLNPVSGTLTLPPFSSVVLFADSVASTQGPTNLNQDPVAAINATPVTGTAPLLVDFDGSSSYDPDGNIAEYNWDFGDGNTATGILAAHTYTNSGNYTASLTVVDDSGAVHTETVNIVVNPATSGCNLSAPWQNLDIGDVAIPGKACEDANGVFSIEASGTDIWDKQDAFHYIYQPLVGDGEIVMRVNSIGLTHNWAKSGVMMRESLDADAKNAMAFIAASGRWTFQRRVSTGGLTTSTNSPKENPIPIPYWIKLVRDGDLFKGYHSSDGITWFIADQEQIPMSTEIYVGIAVTSHDNTVTTSSLVDNVTFTTGGPSSFPVELLYFDGRSVGESVILEWETASELNNAYFTIEKSQDGTLYEVLDDIQGAGTSQDKIPYYLIDENPFKGKSYYRLKQTDFDGTYKYLGTVEIFFDSELKPDVSVYPNPVTGNTLNINLQGMEEGRVLKVALLDMTGREVWVADEIEKSMTVSIPSSLTEGMYMLMVDYGDGLVGERIQIN